MADVNVKKWYVVRAVSGQVNKVKAYIDAEINRLELSDYVSQVLVPTEKVVTVKDGKKIFSKGYGWADKEQNIPFTSGTLASIPLQCLGIPEITKNEGKS